MRRDQRVDGAAELAERLMRARLILAHQPAEPDHVRMQNRGELALAGGGFRILAISRAMGLTPACERHRMRIELGTDLTMRELGAGFATCEVQSCGLGFLDWCRPPRFSGCSRCPPTASSDETRLAISGYDPVAYFTDGKPVPGLTEFEQSWHDARWRFASASAPAIYSSEIRIVTRRNTMAIALGGVSSDAPHKDTVDPGGLGDRRRQALSDAHHSFVGQMEPERRLKKSKRPTRTGQPSDISRSRQWSDSRVVIIRRLLWSR